MLFTLPFLIFSQFLACKGCQENEIIDQGKLQNEDPGFTNHWGRWLDMTITKYGNPAVVYYDSTQGGIGIAYGSLENGEISWTHEEVDGYLLVYSRSAQLVPTTQGRLVLFLARS